MQLNKPLLLAFFFFAAYHTVAQTYNLNFSAVDSDNNRYQLDSVSVFDMSQGWRTTLVYPDTIMSLTVGTAEIRSTSASGSLSSVYPNPSGDRANVFFHVDHETTARVTVYRANADIVYETAIQLVAGGNRVEVTLGGRGVFFMHINANGVQRVAKLVSFANKAHWCVEPPVSYPVPSKGENGGAFTTGDIMRITGYATFKNARIASEPFVGNITSGQDITFSLPISYTAPSVETSEASGVNATGAICGGTVLADGGKPVTTRGVCYSSERTPTVEDNITLNGDGIGDFTAQLENLQPGTTYLFRAYAFNAKGFSYGETKTFTTPLTDDNPYEDGMLSGVFSVSDTQRVAFSKGNLQYSTLGNHLTAAATIESGIWRFAEAQYMYIGDGNSAISENYSGFIDLFGWGTSGWNSGAQSYQPYSASTSNADYLTMRDISGTDADWGHYNAIQNGGNTPEMWRLLTLAEWQYLLSEDNVARNGKNAQATITIGQTEYSGLLLLPDSFVLPEGCQYVAGYANGYSTNQYSLDQWLAMEEAGAVFVVAAGRRNGTTLAHLNARCMYWSGTPNDGNSSHILFCMSGALQSDGVDQVHIGAAVRLVRPVE